MFVIKASKRITHDRRLKDCGELLTYLFGVTSTLGPRLGPLLFQLPPNFKKDVSLLRSFLGEMPERRRMAVEFRHASWFDDEVFEALRGQGAALCIADTGEEPVAGRHDRLGLSAPAARGLRRRGPARLGPPHPGAAVGRRLRVPEARGGGPRPQAGGAADGVLSGVGDGTASKARTRRCSSRRYA